MVGVKILEIILKLKILFVSGFLGLEALDEDDQISQICGYCGIVPELCLGEQFTFFIYLLLGCLEWAEIASHNISTDPNVKECILCLQEMAGKMFVVR